MPTTENHWLFLSSDTGDLLQDGSYHGIPCNWTLYALKVEAFSAKKAKKILGCIRRDLIWRPKEVILPLCSAVVSHLGWCAQCWVPQYRDSHWAYQNESRKGTGRWEQDWSIHHTKRGSELELSAWWRKGSSQILSTCINTCQESIKKKKGRTRLFLVVPWDSTREKCAHITVPKDSESQQHHFHRKVDQVGVMFILIIKRSVLKLSSVINKDYL